MKLQYKKIKQVVAHCGDCGEQLLGNGSIISPYRCGCGVWTQEIGDPSTYILILKCACMINGERNPIFDKHSQFSCSNEELGIMKA